MIALTLTLRFAFATVAPLMLLLAAARNHPASPEIRISDVTRFYALYDATHGKPTAEQLQRQYLDAGSPGLTVFAKWRDVTGERIAKAMAEQPQIYVDAKRCAVVLPVVKTRLAAVLTKFGKMYPKAIFPPVTIAVGRGKPVAIGNASGVMVGLEALCAADTLEADPTDRFVHVIAHEYAHVQQPAAQVEDANEKVLRASLIEGGAEFVAELISGSVSNPHLLAVTKGREKELETAFLEDVDKKADGSRWLYNGFGTAEWPGDLGYWVGYRITKSYYRHAKDKKVALRAIIEMDDAKAFLAKSGWRPGMVLR